MYAIAKCFERNIDKTWFCW